MADKIPREGDVIVYFDIETIPGPEPMPDAIVEHLITNGKAADEQAARDYGSLLPMYGSVLSIGWAIDDLSASCIVGDPWGPAAEADVLAQFLRVLAEANRTAAMRKSLWWLVGHNINGFDIPFLKVRALKHNLPQLCRGLGKASEKPWESRAVDTMTLWPGQRERIPGLSGLQNIAAFLGVPTQDGGIMGNAIADAYRAGNRDAVIHHQISDIDVVRGVFKRLWETM
jgi:DNA polymerase elongation subunit (family B)